MDEAMADFDAAIFSHGLLMAPVPAQWRPYVPALQPMFMLDVFDHAWWASAYLPINAALRAAAERVGLRDWLNPMLSAVAVIATYAVGRQLWPEHPRRAAAAALLLATSSQVVVTAMTAYAMPGHLALNMVWLWLFLRDRRGSDLGALAVAFATTGLHQMIFHPLFAGFFILDLWLKRRWGRAALFTAGYAAICLFWVGYWGLLYRAVGIAPDQAGAVGGGLLVERVMMLLEKVTPNNIGLMAESLVRFISWQNLVVPALALAGGAMALRSPGPMRPMALAILVNLLVTAVLMPTQTHGWGYRYQHGLLGLVVLLAVAGFVSLTAALSDPERRRAVQAVGLLALVSAVVLTPIRVWQARTFSHAFAMSNRAIQQAPADFVLIDGGTVGFDVGTLVRNDPLLQQRPKVFALSALTPAHLDDLCKRGKVWVFDARNPAAKGMLTFAAPWAETVMKLRQHLRETGCAS